MVAALSARTGGIGAVTGDLLGVKSTGALFVGIVRSRTVEDRIIEEFNLKEVYGAARMEDARASLEDRFTVSEDRKSGIITISVTDKSRLRARDMAQSFVRELDRVVAQVSTSAARRERQFLEERLKTVKEELDQAAQEFSQFASKNTAIDIKEQGRTMVEAAATLQGHLIAAQSELEGVRQIYTENNARVRALRSRIEELQRQLNKLGGEPGRTGNPGNPGNSEKKSLYPSIRELPVLGVTYADLYRRTKIAEVVYELLTQQYELAKVQEAKEIPTVKVLDAPVLPEKKSFPPRMAILALGGVFAFSLGAGWVLGGARWAATEASDPGKMLAQEVAAAARHRMARVSLNGSGLHRVKKLFARWRPEDKAKVE
jgi:capsule polysaccharide export protein KpsE/RkpR